jgi:hypothetical protein
MLTSAEAKALANRLENLECIDPQSADGLFHYVFKREPADQAPRYLSHMSTCEYCRVACEIYRYKREIAELLGKDGDQSKIVL